MASPLTSTSAGSTDGTDVTTAAIDTSTATLIVAAVACAKAVTPTFTDSYSNSWTSLGKKNAALLDGLNVFYTSGSGTTAPTCGPGHTFTVPTLTSQFPSVCVMAFAAALIGSIPDVNGVTTGGSGTSLSMSSATPTYNNEIVLALLSMNVNDTVTINGGFAIPQQVDGVSGKAYGSALAYVIQGTATAVSPTWTGSASLVDAVGQLISFQTGPIPSAIDVVISQASKRASYY